MASWANLFGYQATWFAVAWSAGHGRAWIGMLACIAFIGVQWRCSHARRADARVVLAALACGLLVDGIAARTGLLAYASAFPALPAPAWIVLALLAGNGFNTAQGKVLVGGVGGCLLVALFAAPWSALRMSRALQRKMPDRLAAVAGIGAALLAVLAGLTLATGVLLGVLAG